MVKNKIIRKISVIFVTDVIGFSKLMEKNEDLTLASLRSCRGILDDLFEEYNGRLFNTAGDSVLAEFSSAVSALVCATEFQKCIRERNNLVVQDEQLHFRIGLNMGDVVVDGTNLYGEGVNIAARLESLSQADGICISKSVYDFVEKKVNFTLKDLGDQKVKNTIIHAFDVKLDGVNERDFSKNSRSNADENDNPPAIAVLPFKNMSNDEEQEYFADGVTEDIIGHLSLWKTFPVISRNSSFSFKGSSLTSIVISKNLQARYLVEGSTRKGGNKVRITASLIDAEKDNQIWSDRWDRPLDDIFEVQDEISLAIAQKVNPTIRSEEIAKSKEKKSVNTSAWDMYMKALNLFNSKADSQEIFDMCDRSISIDRNFADAYMLKCKTLLRERYKPKNFKKHNEISEKIFGIASIILDREKNNTDALNCMSNYYFTKNDYKNAKHYAKLAYANNPNNGYTSYMLSLIEAFTGNIDAASKFLEDVKFLDPSELEEFPQFEVFLLVAKRKFDEALEKINRAIKIDEKNNQYPGIKAAILGNLNSQEEANETLVQFLKLRPEIKSIEDYSVHLPSFAKETILNGISVAGLK